MPAAFRLSADERRLAQAIPETDLVDLAIELELSVGERIDPEGLLLLAIGRLARLAADEGLPLSAWDLDELSRMPRARLASLARRLGQPADPRALVKAGQHVFRRRYGDRARSSMIPLLLPSLLPLLARYLEESEAPADPT